MDQIITILRAYQSTRSVKATARRVCCARNTVRAYVRTAQSYPGGPAAVLKLSEQQLRQLFFPDQPPSTDPRREYFDSQIEYWRGELPRTGVTRQLLWESYRAKRPGGYGYTRFCALLNATLGHSQLVSVRATHVLDRFYSAFVARNC